MSRDKAEQQMQKAKEMLGITDNRAREIFQEQEDRKQQKKKELKQKQAEKQLEKEENEEKAEEEQGTDYEEILSGSVDDAKETIEKMGDPDYMELLRIEKEGKDRKTMKNYIKKHI